MKAESHKINELTKASLSRAHIGSLLFSSDLKWPSCRTSSFTFYCHILLCTYISSVSAKRGRIPLWFFPHKHTNSICNWLSVLYHPLMICTRTRGMRPGRCHHRSWWHRPTPFSKCSVFTVLIPPPSNALTPPPSNSWRRPWSCPILLSGTIKVVSDSLGGKWKWTIWSEAVRMKEFAGDVYLKNALLRLENEGIRRGYCKDFIWMLAYYKLYVNSLITRLVNILDVQSNCSY